MRIGIRKEKSVAARDRERKGDCMSRVPMEDAV